jgi:3-hydroxyisobutyrate dehydrogenase-like beta-hydroxyacid dehydrogenase
LAAESGLESAILLDAIQYSAADFRMLDVRNPLMVSDEFPLWMKLDPAGC